MRKLLFVFILIFSSINVIAQKTVISGGVKYGTWDIMQGFCIENSHTLIELFPNTDTRNLNLMSVVGFERLSDSHINVQPYVTYQGVRYTIYNIEDDAFQHHLMSSITLPNTLKNIGQCAFAYCTNLKEIKIPNSVMRIEGLAFAGCSSLKKVYIPNSVLSLTGNPFVMCPPDINIVIQEGSRYKYENGFIISNTGALVYVNDRRSIIIPNTVSSIEPYAFYGCKQFTYLKLPNSVHRICDCAFRGCFSLEKVYIPRSVRLFHSLDVFAGCNSLKEIYMESDSPLKFEDEPNHKYMDDIYANVTLRVHESAVSAYRSAPGWCNFKNIVAYH